MEFLILMALLGGPLLVLALLVGALEELGVMHPPSEDEGERFSWLASLFEEEDRGA